MSGQLKEVDGSRKLIITVFTVLASAEKYLNPMRQWTLILSSCKLMDELGFAEFRGAAGRKRNALF